MATVLKKVAIVTGANKGIGLGIVKGLASNFDGHVYLTARNQERGLAALDALRKEGLINVSFHQMDIDDTESIVKLRNYIVEKYGGLDVLVNNWPELPSKMQPRNRFTCRRR